jgi:hypothetical protein
MKRLLQMMMLFLLINLFAQNKEFIKLKGDIPNNGEEDYNSLIVIDKRINKSIGFLPFGDNREMKEVSFPTSAEEDLVTWYRKSNLKGGKQDLVLVLNNLELSVKEAGERRNIGRINFSVQSFLKEGNNYKFLYKKDTVFMYSHSDVSDVMVKNIHHLFSLYFDRTYKAKPVNYNLSIDEVSDYKAYVSNFPVFKNEVFKDGIYLDYNTFFRQTPEEGNYFIERFEEGKPYRAVKNENGKKKKIPLHKAYIFVENGKAYKNTFSGFQEVFKNEKGVFLLARPNSLFPPQYNPKLGLIFGLAGSIADAILYSPKSESAKTIQEIYIDPMTGQYDFVDILNTEKSE